MFALPIVIDLNVLEYRSPCVLGILNLFAVNQLRFENPDTGQPQLADPLDPSVELSFALKLFFIAKRRKQTPAAIKHKGKII